MANFYVCSKYNCTWYGKVSDMLDDYGYPTNSTFYFNTEEECIAFIDSLSQ